MSYIIRDANHSDILDLVIASKQFGKEIPHKSVSKFDTNKISEIISNLINSEAGFVKVVEYDKEVVGCLMAVASELVINRYIASQELLLWIDPDHRNGKTSSQLIDSYVEWSKSIGCDFVRLSAQNQVMNGKAGILFKRKGFQAMETAYVKDL